MNESLEIMQEDYNEELRLEFEAVAAAKKGQGNPWTDEIDRALLDARDRLGLNFKEIARVIRAKYGFGCDKTVSQRYRDLREGKAP